MNSEKTSHPEHILLLRYADGELRDPECSEVREHLSACSACRDELDGLNSGTADYRRWMSALRGSAEPPPKPWFDLQDHFHALDRTAGSSRTFPIRLRWVAAAAAAAIVIAAAYRISEQTVSAAELLRDAESRESRDHALRPPIRVATRSGSTVRPAVWRQPAETALRSRFETANYSWDDPLSAKSFSAWRATLSDPVDRVVRLESQDGTRSYEITTNTTTGMLSQASLRLRAADLRAVEGNFRFRDAETVQILEVPGASPDGLKAPATWTELPAIATRNEATAPVTPGEELQVWAALRRLGADLGEPIQVARDLKKNAIIVTATGLGPARRNELQQVLDKIPKTQLQFVDPQPMRTPRRQLPEGAGATNAPLLPEIESRLGRAHAEEFVDRTLEASESCLVRAHALRELAERYPPTVEAQLSAADRELLASLTAEHYAGLQSVAQRVLESAGRISATSKTAPLPVQDWQTHAGRIVTAVERLDAVLTRLLAGGRPDRPAGELEEAASQFDAEINAAGQVIRRSR